MGDIYTDWDSGNDAGGLGVWNDPYKTLQKAIDVAAAPDVIWVGDTAAEVLAAEIGWGGGWGGGTSRNALLLIRGWDISEGASVGGRAEIDGNDAIATIFATASQPEYVALHDIYFHSTTGLLIDPSSYWYITHCKVADCGDNNTLIDRDYGGLIMGCEIVGHNPLSNGIYVHAFQITAFNYFHGGTYSSASLRIGGLISTVIGNVIADVSGHGIVIADGLPFVYGNTLVGQSIGSKFGIQKYNDVACAILNNIFKDWDVGIESDTGEEVLLCGHNLFYNSGTADERTLDKLIDLGNDITGTDPAFVDAGGANYACGSIIRAAGYPAIIEATATVNYVDIGAAQRREKTAHIVGG